MPQTSYPDNFMVLLPEPYLTSIGKVCVQWSNLENVANIALHKLLGLELFDPRGTMLTAHMTWPLKIDVLGSLIDSLRHDYQQLARYEKVGPMLVKAQAGRNRVVHATWAYDNGTVRVLRATARGKLKATMDPITVADIDAISTDIGKASAALLKMILNK